ncbi:MAG: hypothetical protein HY042_02695 [Spirochaetia bacterium]|nr:hypothetical protein [Spirochaetia bacterium]
MMLNRFSRSFFWGILIASLVAWLYVGYVSAGSHEAVLIEDHVKGMDTSPIHPGETRFIPARAYPNRITLHRVDIGPRVKEFNFKAALPQAEILDLDDKFSVRIQTRLEYDLDVEALYALFWKLDQRTWERLDPFIELRLNDFFTRQLNNRLLRNDGDLATLKQRTTDYLEGDALRDLSETFKRDGIRIQAIAVMNVYVPDAGAYRAVIARSGEIIQQKVDHSKKKDQARASQEEDMIRDQAYYARLEHVGKLLREYPNLRDYLAIDRLGNNVQVMVFPYDRWFSGSGDPDTLQKVLDKKKAGNGGGAAGNPQGNPAQFPGRLPEEAQGRAGNRVRDLTPP